MPTANPRIIILLSVTILSGCLPSLSKKTPISPDRTLITSRNLDRITGMQWTLKDMTVDGKEFKLTGEMPFVKLEKDGRITGFASINRFFGSMTIDDKGEVKWPSSLGATRMAGPPALMTQEDAFLKALVQTGSVAIERIYLYMTSADNKTTLTFYVPVR